MTGEAHSLFSASGAAGWSVCYAKPALEKGRKRSSQYADEGTAAHTLASWVLADRLDGGVKTAANWRGKKITVQRDDGPARSFTVGDEMIEHVDTYVDGFMAMSQGRGVERFCEQKVHYHEYLGVEKRLAWGTSDGVAILWNAPVLEWEGPNGVIQLFEAGDELQVHDLKYGKGYQVDAPNNAQLRLYALGTLYEFGHLADFTRVRMVIHQPRKEHLSEEVISVAELVAWAASLRVAAPMVIAANKLAAELRAEGYEDLDIAETMLARGWLKESEKGCAFCDAAGICAAKIGTVSEATAGRRASADDFDDLTVDAEGEIRSYGGNYLAHAYAQIGAIEAWIKGVLAEIDRRVLLKGEKIPGVKVVPGKKGSRAFKDAPAAEAYIKSQIPAAVRSLLFKEAMLTPTQMEKALKKTHPAYWVLLQPLIHQAEGKPAVVPESDPRAAMSHKARIDEFDDLTEEQPAPETGARAGAERHPFR